MTQYSHLFSYPETFYLAFVTLGMLQSIRSRTVRRCV